MIYWFTGQPGHGKTTLAKALIAQLKRGGYTPYHIDGDDLRNITNRFAKHFSGIIVLRKKLEEAMKATDDFGRDARSITRTLENIKNSSNSDDDDDPDSPTTASTYGQVSEGKH